MNERIKVIEERIDTLWQSVYENEEENQLMKQEIYDLEEELSQLEKPND